ncbi:hypothetical protein V6R21_27260 [Limibacter armeniacum]|uniref:hypothetical protein n=1 Tax=Limibacter armeniacum TaxID=466084 RepID=UPI002FE571EF
MKKNLIKLASAAMLLALASCGQHNTAPSKGVNLDSERIYGKSRTATPAQLDIQYPEPTSEDAERVNKIREELFPN